MMKGKGFNLRDPFLKNDFNKTKPMTNNINKKVKKGNHIHDDNNIPEIENYIQDEIDAQIDEFNTLSTLDDIYESRIIDLDDLYFELSCELEKRIRQLKCEEHQCDKNKNIAIGHKYENWIHILEQSESYISSRELDVLDKCISGYASECGPWERRKELRRNIFRLLNSSSEINRISLLELDYKINHIDEQTLFELTEILLELDNLFYCFYNPDDSQELSLSAFLYHWEESGIDYIQDYEIHTEICWIKNGLIHDYLEADGLDYFVFDNGKYQPEYCYYTKQFYNQYSLDSIELGIYECLCEDDLFKDTWLVADKKFPNLIDYYYEAEETELYENGPNCRDYFSQNEYDNYSKYRCYQGELGFYYCNKECCDKCTHVYTEKVINEQYILWKKYVQPIKLE